jgi:hypothetical protein
MERDLSMMRLAAAGEVLFVFAGVVAYIWRLQFTFPDFAIVLLVFIIATFFLHQDRLQDLGLGSHGLLVGMREVAIPTLMIGGVLALAAVLRGASPLALLTADKLVSVGKYFAWCLLQEFVLQSIFRESASPYFQESKTRCLDEWLDLWVRSHPQSCTGAGDLPRRLPADSHIFFNTESRASGTGPDNCREFARSSYSGELASWIASWTGIQQINKPRIERI